MANSIRDRLLIWFIAFMLLTAGLIIPANIVYNSKEKNITQLSDDINLLYIEFLKKDKAVNDFLTIEPESNDFYTKGQSRYLNVYQKTDKDIHAHLIRLSNKNEANAQDINEDIAKLEKNLDQYNRLFDSLTYLVYKRGWRDFGLKGELSEYISKIEKASGLSNSDIYRLKKIESDYFFNKDAYSVSKLENLIIEINSGITSKNKLSVINKSETINLLNNYAKAFKRLIKLDSQAGIGNNLALSASLNKKSSDIEKLLISLSEKILAKQKALISRLNILYSVSLLIIISMAVLFSYLASRHIVSHLEALTNYISSLTKHNIDKPFSVNLNNSAKEINQIYSAFRNLLSQLKIWERQRDNAIRNADDNQQRYRELADMLPQSVFETDSYGNYSYVNKAWHKAFGYELSDINEGLNLIETLISESGEEDILGIQKIENSNYLAIRKNGTRFPASVYTDNIVKNGKISGRRGIIIDITDRINYIKSLEEETSKARTSDELKSSFLANMSHEIRTPMNSIIGFSNLLASEQVPDIQKKDFTRYIRTSSEILLNLVDDIIDIAKIEAGELKIVKKDCELSALGAELLSTSIETRKKFNKPNINIEFNPDPLNVKVFLKTDPFRLRQILINLINNALKFTDKGSVTFGYAVKEESVIEFYVKDTGPGLSRDELNLIFERFKRSRRSEEKNIAGTGLGLAISKNLVQLLGGEMWVDSVPGQGTTFLFTVPYLRPTVLPADKAQQYKSETEYNWSGKSILIVEDDLNSFNFLHELLKNTGVEIIHATSGKKAIEIVRSYGFINLIIMDIQLPEMDGLEATRIIKEIKRDVPVIAQTAHAMSGDKEKIKGAGCDDYFSKPVDSNRLMATINHYFLISKKPGKVIQNSTTLNQSGIISN